MAPLGSRSLGVLWPGREEGAREKYVNGPSTFSAVDGLGPGFGLGIDVVFV